MSVLKTKELIMRKYQLFSEFNETTIYGKTLADAVMHATIKTLGKYDQESQKVVGSVKIEIEKVLGYDDTSKSTRGNNKFESVIVETKDGKRLSIDAQYIGEIVTA